MGLAPHGVGAATKPAVAGSDEATAPGALCRAQAHVVAEPWRRPPGAVESAGSLVYAEIPVCEGADHMARV